MKKLMLLAAALTMALMTAVPAVAQVGQENDQEGESGEVDQSFTVTGSGDGANQCTALLGGAQSGNSQDQIAVTQSDESEADEVEFDETGSDITLRPELAEECEQIINQAAASTAAPKATPAPKVEEKEAEAKKSEAKTSSTQDKAEEKKAEEKKAGEEKKKELPKTGGSGTASLFALATGVLLVAGGLLARRIFR